MYWKGLLIKKTSLHVAQQASELIKIVIRNRKMKEVNAADRLVNPNTMDWTPGLLPPKNMFAL